ncbi:MAG: hypothetical protein ACI4OE_07055 [Alphaproteobacteria bacterium]
MSDYQVVIDSATIDVTIGEGAEIQVEQAVQYIKSGEKEIDAYVSGTAKPEIDSYVETVSKPDLDAHTASAKKNISGYVEAVSKPDLDSYVAETSKPEIAAYVENTSKPDIRDFTNDRVAEFDANAAEKLTAYNNNDTAKTNAYNSNAAEKLTAYNNNDADKTASYNANAAEKLTAYNANAAEKQSAVDASALAAANSAAAAKTSEINSSASMVAAAASAQSAANSETEALNSETAAAISEARCEEIFARLGTVIKIKGRVDTLEDLPQSGNLDGDAYLVGAAGLAAYPEYYWFSDHWEFLGTSADKIEWGTLQGNIANQTDLQTALNAKQATITGAASTITSANLTVSRALVSDSNGKVAVSAVTSTELGYLDGVTSAIQTQLNGKQASITGAASTITSANLTASRALVSDSNGKVAVSAVTSTELGYLDGVTSAIQTQLNAKAPLASPAFTGTPTVPTAATTTNNTQAASTAFVYNRIINILNTLYPVGSVYIGTQSTCPLATLISGSTWNTIATNVVVGVNTNVPVKGNGMTLGLTNGTTNAGLSTYSNANYLGASPNSYGQAVGQTYINDVGMNKSLGVTTDSSKSGIVGTVTRTNLAVNIWKRTA